MKKIFFQFPETQSSGFSPHGFKSWGPWVWLLVHLGILALLGLSVFFAGPVRVNTLLQDMLPQGGKAVTAAQADRIFGEKNGRETIILAAAPEFEHAKEGAAFLYAEFENSPMVEAISFFFDTPVIAQFNEYLQTYRFVIAEKETLRLLETGRAEEIAMDALATAYGAFNFFPLDNIDKDPFLLAGRRMETFLASSLLSGGNLGLKDDVLSANVDGTWYVLLRMTLAPWAVSVSGGKSVVREIYAAASTAKEAIPGLELYFSGVPFHSYESSSGAQREITIISVLTLIIIFAVFLYFFRTPLPIVVSILAAGISVGMASATAFLVFREVHIITFVFGTTLIGTCLDYSIHFFVHWKANASLKNGYAVRSYISKSIIICFVSTEICFAIFFFSPFPILRQFAVFSMAGIFSSFLTSYCLYPCLTMPEEGKRKLGFLTRKLSFRLKIYSLSPVFGIIIMVIFAVIGLTVLIVSPHGMKIKNDISSLYTMSASLLESEKRAALILDHGSPFWYFIVSGSSPEETLEHEEILVQRLEEEVARGNLGSFFGTSFFIPSIKTQKKTYEAMKALLPLAQAQYENLGFPPEYAQTFYDEFAAGIEYCLPENAPPNVGISNLWIGKAGENYYSCVMPLHPGDELIFRSIAENLDFVHFINKAQDISRDLDTLTKTVLLLFLVAYLVISVMVFFVYPWSDSLKICAVPFFLVLIALAVLAACKIPLGFFSVAGLMLVFGLGLDYIFYMTGKKYAANNSPSKDDAQYPNGTPSFGSVLTPLAVLLSFLTTLLAFGALAFSNFTPVHIFGLTVCAGLSAAFISAMLLQGRTK
jgi:predicted exporter